jgi:hypothetical protein
VSQSYLPFCNGRNKRRLLAALMFQANGGWGSAALAILFSLILCGGLAAVQQRDPQDGSTLSIEDLMKIKVPTVCGPSKFEQKITEAPSFITIITSDEIRKQGYRTFAEVLRRSRDRRSKLRLHRDPRLPGPRIVPRPHADSDRWNVYDGAYIGPVCPMDLELTKSVVRAARNSRLTGAWAVHTILL